MTTQSTNINLLVEQIAAADPMLRKGAIVALGTLGSVTEDVILALARALQDPNEEVSREACFALFMQKADSKPAIPHLIQALQHEDLIVRRLAAATLALIGADAEVASTELSKLEQDTDPILRAWVTEALGAIGRKDGPSE